MFDKRQCRRLALHADARVQGHPDNHHRLDAGKNWHNAADFLKMIHGKIPVLRSEDILVHESLAIMAFIESVNPESLLFGRTLAETGHIWQRIMEVVDYNQHLIQGGAEPCVAGGSALSAKLPRRGFTFSR
jgi:glutathione S-transferase